MARECMNRKYVKLITGIFFLLINLLGVFCVLIFSSKIGAAATVFLILVLPFVSRFAVRLFISIGLSFRK